MDLNMIMGLGRSYQQILIKNKIDDVEQLLRFLPSKIDFFNATSINLIKENQNVTIKGQIVSNIINYDDENLKFKFKSDEVVIECMIKNSHLLKKHLLTGKILKINGMYSKDTNLFTIFQVFDEEEKHFEIEYDMQNINSSQMEKFIQKGLNILNNYDNELPQYIKNKSGYSNFKDVLLNIHNPKSSDIFVKALCDYTYEIIFNLFVKYYYYILSTSLQRDENPYDLTRISTVISDYKSELLDENKSIINNILKEFKRNIYSNVIVENKTMDEKFLITLLTIVAKVSTKSQVILVSKENFGAFTELKSILSKYGMKAEIMTKKGKNKENFSTFNSGSCDVVITQPVNFSSLNTTNTRLIIIDSNEFNTNNRFDLNCKNADTLFFTNTKFGANLDKDIFKNVTVFSKDEHNFVNSFYENYFYSENFEIIKKSVKNEKILEILKNAAEDAYDFIKTKKFTLAENSLYFKKIIEK